MREECAVCFFSIDLYSSFTSNDTTVRCLSDDNENSEPISHDHQIFLDTDFDSYKGTQENRVIVQIKNESRNVFMNGNI